MVLCYGRWSGLRWGFSKIIFEDSLENNIIFTNSKLAPPSLSPNHFTSRLPISTHEFGGRAINQYTIWTTRNQSNKIPIVPSARQAILTHCGSENQPPRNKCLRWHVTVDHKTLDLLVDVVYWFSKLASRESKTWRNEKVMPQTVFSGSSQFLFPGQYFADIKSKHTYAHTCICTWN